LGGVGVIFITRPRVGVGVGGFFCPTPFLDVQWEHLYITHHNSEFLLKSYNFL